MRLKKNIWKKKEYLLASMRYQKEKKEYCIAYTVAYIWGRVWPIFSYFQGRYLIIIAINKILKLKNLVEFTGSKGDHEKIRNRLHDF